MRPGNCPSLGRRLRTKSLAALRPSGDTELRVRVVDLNASREIYRFMYFTEPDGSFFQYSMFMIDGLVWFAVPADVLMPVPQPVAQLRTVELADGMCRRNLPAIRPRQLTALPAVVSAVNDARITARATSGNPAT